MHKQLSEDDITRRLESYRPGDRADEWGQTERAAALEAALHAERATVIAHSSISRRRRWLTVAGGVAAVAAAVLVIEFVPSSGHRQPAGSSERPGTPTTSSSLPSATSGVPTSPAPIPQGPVGRLAEAARHTTLGNPQDGQFWYHKVDLYQPSGRGKTPTLVGSNTNWVAANGDDWLLEDEGGSPLCTYYPYLGTPNPNHPNTDYLRSLPTDPSALETYLRAHVSGSNSIDQAVVVAISDTFGNYEGLVPPDLRAAFIEVLARVPSVTVRSGVQYGDGGTATTFTYKNDQSLWFDETTAQVVGQQAAPEYQIVDTLPDRVASRQTCPRGDN
jgi:hypothetical protein